MQDHCRSGGDIYLARELHSYSYIRIDGSWSNNIAEYNALLIGLQLEKWGYSTLKVIVTPN